MTPERMARLAALWVRLYTRGLSTPIAERRVDEIDRDVRDQIEHGRAHGASDRRIALSILSRILRGAHADASWRRVQPTSRQHGAVLRSSFGIVRATALILLVPLIAMQLTDAVVWTVTDFIAAGVLLAGTGLLYRLAAKAARGNAYRVAVGGALAAALMLVWASLAVGLIGEQGDRADLMYGAVLAVGVAGAVATRARPRGMARTLLAMALVQGLVVVIALIAGKHEDPAGSVSEILGVNAFFAGLFVGSACLFRLSERRQDQASRRPDRV